MMGKCNVCNDRGWYKDECCGERDCDECRGSGMAKVDCYKCKPSIKPIGKSNVWGWVIGVAVAIVAVILFDPGVDPVSAANHYEVLSVYKGALQVKDVSTGQVGQIFNAELVTKALQGVIKKGDIIIQK